VSVRIRVTIEVENRITIQELKEWVVAEDSDDTPIAIENVSAEDILRLLLQSAVEYQVVEEEMTE
jgi:hypothetical protein